MKIVTKEFIETSTYKEFAVGEKVRLNTNYFDEEGWENKIYEVTEFCHPMFYSCNPVVFVKGYKYGIDSGYFEPVESVET